MHGRVKERTSEEKKAIIFKQQQAKLKAYREGIDTIFSQRKSNECNEGTLKLITKLLCHNPDIYTLWNIRREILLNGETQIKQEDVSNELALTEECLRTNPKSYSAWHHRCWVLDHCPNPDWQREVDLCARYLKLDERNFHCWDYRQFVVKRAQISYDDELKFSTEKILHNFSNYSSWHYRSILYKTLSPKSDLFKDELDLVQNAAFTDPNDTSAWFYQRWLLGKMEIPLRILLAVFSPTAIIVSLTRPIGNSPTIYVNREQMAVNLRPFDENSKFSSIWISLDIPPVNDVDLKLCSISIRISDEIRCDLKYDENSEEFRYMDQNKLMIGVNFNEEIRGILTEQLASCRELLVLEPDSKWTLLTTALLLRGLGGDENNSESISLINKLEVVDTLRKGYYADLRSQWILSDFLNDKINKSDSLFNKFQIDNPSITALYYLNYLIGSKCIVVSSKIFYEKLKDKLKYLKRTEVCLLDN